MSHPTASESAHRGCILPGPLCLMLGALLAAWPCAADSIEDVQSNSLRKAASLDGAWEVVGPVKTNDVPAWSDDPVFAKGWAGGVKFDDAKQVNVPLNLYYSWLSFAALWKPGVGVEDPLDGLEHMYGFSQRCIAFCEGKSRLVVWYRRTVSVPALGDGRRMLLHFAGVATTAEVFVNGQFAGRHQGAFAAFCVDATPHVKAGENLVAVRCTVQVGGEHGQHWGNSNPNYAGLWRSVHLLELDQEAVEYVLIDPHPVEKNLSIRVRLFKNASRPLEVRASVKGDAGANAKGTLEAGQRESRLSIPFSGQEWRPETPVLHTLNVTLARKGTIVDEKEARFGFRSFEAAGDKLLLNGQPVRVMGFGENGNHFGGEGHSRQEVQERYAQLYGAYKRAGGNVIRWHNSAISEQNRAADEVGYLLYSGGPDKNLATDFGDDYWTYLQEYVFQNYNHPSVIMWHFSNEDWGDTDWEVLNRIYDKVRPLDTSGRPIIPDSGSYSFPGLPSTVRGRMDVVDIHNYTGVTFKACGGYQRVPFTRTTAVMKETADRVEKIFGRRMPIILGECQADTIWEGMGSGHWSGPDLGGYHRKVIGADGLVRPEIFEEIEQYSHSWCDIGHGVKHLGLATYMGKPEGLDVGRLADWTGSEIVKDCIEQYRLMRFPGIFVNSGRPENWLRGLPGVLSGRNYGQTIFSPILPIAIDIPRQIFSDQDVEINVSIDNNTGSDQKDLILKVIVDDLDKKVIRSGSPLAIPQAPWESAICVPASVQVPKDFSGPATVHLVVSRGDQIVGESFYHFSVTPAAVRGPLAVKQRLLVWRPQKKDVADTLRVLDDLRIAYSPVSTGDLRTDEKQTDWLLIPARAVFDGDESPEWSGCVESIVRRVRGGMNVLVLEQSGEGTLRIGPSIEYSHRPGNVTADPTMFDHPLLARVPWDKWWVWRGDDGDIAPYVISANRNTLAVVGAQADDRVYSILSEGTLDKGRIIFSQPDAVSRWNKDAAATLYLRELLQYALASEPWKRVQPWTGKSREYAVANREQLLCIDLRPYFNRSWSDDVADDGQGGWTDEGNNDFSHFKPPRMSPDFETYQKSYAAHLAGKAWLLGLPFDIPENGATEKSCIVVGAVRLAPEVTGIGVGLKVERVFFLGTATYNGKGNFVIHYEDGQTVTVATRFPDWWAGGDIDDVRVAWRGENPKSKAMVCCFIQPWDNPRPEAAIRSIDLTGDHVVLLGMTVYQGK